MINLFIKIQKNDYYVFLKKKKIKGLKGNLDIIFAADTHKAFFF